ncbi:MAG: ribonuclease P protein component [Polaribacter sp.]
MKHTLGKEERLKSRKLIEKLYQEGNSIKAFPLRMLYVQTAHTSEFPVQMGVSVAKRNFKRAVDRNRIKRLLREAYRLQKQIVYNTIEKPHVFMISYLGREMGKYEEIYPKMEKLLTLFVNETKKKLYEEN